MRPPAFSPGQVVGAASLAGLVQAGLVLSVVLTRAAGGASVQREPPLREMRIAVKPMLDAPLLKKGAPQVQTPNLPNMFKPPNPPPPVERKPVPAPDAKTPRDAPDPKPTRPDDRPPPETPQAKRVDDMVRKMQREAQESDPSEAAPPEQGGEDGVAEGTEKDPLKARATDSYKGRLQLWFHQGFSVPVDELDCPTLLALEAKVRAQIGSDREVVSYSMESSGNEIFDQRVRAAMEAHVGQSVPPPPPNYPELLERVFLLAFVGENEKCK